MRSVHDGRNLTPGNRRYRTPQLAERNRYSSPDRDDCVLGDVFEDVVDSLLNVLCPLF